MAKKIDTAQVNELLLQALETERGGSRYIPQRSRQPSTKT